MKALFVPKSTHPPAGARSAARSVLRRLSVALSVFLSITCVLLGTQAAHAAAPTVSAPVALSGWNQDLIADKSSSPTNPLGLTTANFSGFALYEDGAFGLAHGLPGNGLLTSQFGDKVGFQLQPAGAKNVLVVASGSATLTLARPQSFHALQFLHASEGTPGATWSATLNFTDNSTTVVSAVSSSDWRSFVPGNAVVNVSVAKPAPAVCKKVGFQKICLPATGVTTELRNLNETDYTLTGVDQNKFLKSITFTKTAGGPLIVLALSGRAAYALPSAAVAGANLSSAQLTSVLGWIQSETAITSTPFCYKTDAYDRGIGILPGCGNGKQLDGALCYDSCRSGYKGVGPTCWTTESLTYNPGRHCTKSVPVLGCVASAMNSCRDGYHGDKIATCYIDKASYGRGAGSTPNTCNSNREMQAGLCYLTPRTGYSCNVTNCSQRCAAGTVDCLGAACANNANSCASNISDMIVSPALMLANLPTAGAVGAAVVGVKAAKNAYRIADDATKLAAATQVLYSNISNFMAMSENNLAAISSVEVERQVAARYGAGSANYKLIARSWAARQLLFYITDLMNDLSILMIVTADESQVSATVQAFAKPLCGQHTTMP